jgi:bifunctional DNase/RNase
MIEVRVEGILLDSANSSPVALLRELDGDRVLPIFIGPLEAAALDYALKEVTCPRPLTLDLMRRLVEGMNGHIERVVITRIEDETYFAEIMIRADGRVVAIDARPSDSVALAVRIGAPIFVAEEVMDRAGQWMTPAEEERLKELRAQARSLKPEEFGNYRM